MLNAEMSLELQRIVYQMPLALVFARSWLESAAMTFKSPQSGFQSTRFLLFQFHGSVEAVAP
jgi:hypothetical protein